MHGQQNIKTYHFHEPILLKSGSLNVPEPSGPVQACNGIAVTFYIFQKTEFGGERVGQSRNIYMV